MEARIVIDLSTATPPYEQIQSQIASLIAVGELREGTRLPTVRSLAADLGVAAGTVARAYKELEAAGAVSTNRRQGTVVTGFRQAQSPASPGWVSTGSTTGSLAGPVETGSLDTRNGPPAEVMAAVEQLMEAGMHAGLDNKTLVSLLQGRLAQRDGSRQARPPEAK
ncbi:MAG: GntR family transcriptional regulator [Specibacter sp.]